MAPAVCRQFSFRRGFPCVGSTAGSRITTWLIDMQGRLGLGHSQFTYGLNTGRRARGCFGGLTELALIFGYQFAPEALIPSRRDGWTDEAKRFGT